MSPAVERCQQRGQQAIHQCLVDDDVNIPEPRAQHGEANREREKGDNEGGGKANQ